MLALAVRARIRASAICLATLLAACGGGGGDGGGSSGQLPALNYSGNTNAAAVSATNASQLVGNIFGSVDTANAVAGVAISDGQGVVSGGAADLGLRLSRTSRNILSNVVLPDPAQRPLTGFVPVDQTDPCDSGSVRVFGTLSDFGTGTLTVNYQNCLDGDETVNGQGTFRVDVFDMGLFVPTDFTITSSRLTFRGTGISFDSGGTVRVQLDAGARTETITQDMVSLNNLTGASSKSENLVFVNTYDNFFFPSSYTGTLNGRIYNGVHGYVDVSTLTPVAFANLSQSFPHSGQLLLTGGSNRHIRVAATSSTLATLDLDLDGDGNFERTAAVAWLDLSTTSGTDLRDSDGDGMHDGWEMAKGLDRNVNDAALDADGDSFTNLQEYLAGTHPNDAASVPPVGPAPGSGSDPAPLAFNGTVVSLPGVNDLAYDAGTQTLFAAVRTANTVVPINPVSGALGTPIAVGMEPVKLAISGNGQYLYVGFNGEASLQRINLANQSVDLTIPLGTGTFGEVFAEDIAVLPGNAQAVAVSLKYKLVSPRHAGVAIYDGATRRAAVTPGHQGSNVIEFSASAGTLYGYNNETTEYGFRRLAVDAAGVTQLDVHDSFNPAGALIEGFGVDMRFHSGLIYTTTGRVIDPVERTILGTFVLAGSGSVAADASAGRVYFIASSSIRAYSQTSAQPPVAIMPLPGVSGIAEGLLRTGSNGLALRTSGGQVFLIQSGVLVP